MAFNGTFILPIFITPFNFTAHIIAVSVFVSYNIQEHSDGAVVDTLKRHLQTHTQTDRHTR